MSGHDLAAQARSTSAGTPPTGRVRSGGARRPTRPPHAASAALPGAAQKRRAPDWRARPAPPPGRGRYLPGPGPLRPATGLETLRLRKGPRRSAEDARTGRRAGGTNPPPGRGRARRRTRALRPAGTALTWRPGPGLQWKPTPPPP